MSKDLAKITQEPSMIFFFALAGEKIMFRAPEGYMFDIKAITFTPAGNADNHLMIYDKELPEEVTFRSYADHSEGIIAIYHAELLHHHQKMFPQGYVCKYISAIWKNATSTYCLVSIDYKLVTATPKRLIYEYVKNARIR
jgi:hypothetical protein